MQLIAGNWKMNGLGASIAQLDTLIAAGPVPGVELLLCPPATLIAPFAARAAKSHVAIGAQDCHPEPAGAFTGDLSAPMLADAGATHTIVGHSERRQHHGEGDALVRAKAEAAIAAGLVPIVCVGETLDEREAGDAFRVVERQVRDSIPEAGGFAVAYEPVWAIGTGQRPTGTDIAAMHAAIAMWAPAGVRILYGGSVNPGNAGAILGLPGVGGALVGGASLKAADFLSIARAAPGAAP
jgi:triosephosphate isomerase